MKFQIFSFVSLKLKGQYRSTQGFAAIKASLLQAASSSECHHQHSKHTQTRDRLAAQQILFQSHLGRVAARYVIYCSYCREKAKAFVSQNWSCC